MSLDKHANSIDGKADVEQIEERFSVEETQEYVVDPAEERRLLRKIDMRVMPIVCIVYLFAYLDRTNLGNARLQGLPEDVLGGDPTGVLFDWVNSAFFFSYVICQVPATVTAKLVAPRLWIGAAAVGWGLASTLTSTGFNFAGMMVARVALGMFEAGFGPGIPIYMSLWYTKSEIGLRMAVYFAFAAVAGAFGGLIAFGVQQAHAAIANWRLLFIVEGVPTILLGIMTMFLLPDRPEETRFLNEDQRRIQLVRMNRGIKADVGRTLNRKHIAAAFKDWRIYPAAVIFFGTNCAAASIGAFLPTIIKTFGYTNAKAQLFTVPPYAVCAVILCINAWLCDRYQSRGLSIIIFSIVGGIGYLIMLTVQNVHVRYFATFCIITGTYNTIGVIIAWYAHNLGSETKKATGIPFYMSIGQCGSILGSHIFLATEGPSYTRGFAITCALELLGAVSALVLTISYRLDNRWRDRTYGKVKDVDAAVETRELADKAPMFRYIP